MIIEDKITVKHILKKNYNKFKNKYCFQAPKNMREHIYDVVNKALMCSDIKYGFAEYRCVICGGYRTIFCSSRDRGVLNDMLELEC